MKVLHVIADMDLGGAQKLILQLARMSHAQGIETVVAASPGMNVTALRSAGARFTNIPLGSTDAIAAARALTGLICLLRTERPTVLHTHNVRATAMSCVAKVMSRWRGTTITTMHGVEPGRYPAAVRVLRHTTDRVVACGPAVYGLLRDAGYPKEALQTIWNGVELPPAVSDRPTGKSGLDPVVLGVGRLVDQKNWPLFIEVAVHCPEFRFIVLGDGPLAASLIDLSCESGCRVEFAGPRSDVAVHLQRANCLLITSRWEGLPMAALEAIASGLPVVATSGAGLASMGETWGVVECPPGAETLAAAVRAVVEDREWASELAQRSLENRDALDWKRSCEDYLDLYRAAGRC
jgi:glycosyltransferase involved in cell wall biosynthesis